MSVMDRPTAPAPASEREANWIDICALDDVPVRGSRVVRAPHGCVAIFRTANGEAFALEDRCPHAGGPLSQGIVHGKSVTCPLHNWVIALETGEALGADKGRVRTIPLRIEGGRILLDAALLPPSPRPA